MFLGESVKEKGENEVRFPAFPPHTHVDECCWVTRQSVVGECWVVSVG